VKLIHLSKRDWSILIGNTLDHFDSAIYGFIAPIIAPLFFPNQDPVVQLILIYSLLATSLVTRPLGAFIFGALANRRDPEYLLSISLVGVAILTTAMGFLPTYATVGWMAPLFLILVRFIRGLFCSGESTIAKLYILEDRSRDQSLSISHAYQSSSVLGIIIASLMVTLITHMENPEQYWRIPFWLGSFTGLVGVYLRWKKLPQKLLQTKEKSNSMKLLWKDRLGILKIAFATNVSHLTYGIPFVFLNTFVPLVTAITLEQMMILNTVFLGLDMALIPLFGKYLKRFSVKKVLFWSSALLTLTSIPLFCFLGNASLIYVTFIRCWVVMLGLVYLCPLNVWYLDQFEGQKKYLLIGMGNALSAGTVGRLTTATCLFLWHETGWIWAPAIYMTVFFALGAMAVWYSLPRRMENP
jgi:MFS family permease